MTTLKKHSQCDLSVKGNNKIEMNQSIERQKVAMQWMVRGTDLKGEEIALLGEALPVQLSGPHD